MRSLFLLLSICIGILPFGCAPTPTDPPAGQYEIVDLGEYDHDGIGFSWFSFYIHEGGVLTEATNIKYVDGNWTRPDRVCVEYGPFDTRVRKQLAFPADYVPFKPTTFLDYDSHTIAPGVFAFSDYQVRIIRVTERGLEVAKFPPLAAAPKPDFVLSDGTVGGGVAFDIVQPEQLTSPSYGPIWLGRAYVWKGAEITLLPPLPDHTRAVARGMIAGEVVYGTSHKRNTKVDSGESTIRAVIWENGVAKDIAPDVPYPNTFTVSANSRTGQIAFMATDPEVSKTAMYVWRDGQITAAPQFLRIFTITNDGDFYGQQEINRDDVRAPDARLRAGKVTLMSEVLADVLKDSGWKDGNFYRASQDGALSITAIKDGVKHALLLRPKR